MKELLIMFSFVVAGILVLAHIIEHVETNMDIDSLSEQIIEQNRKIDQFTNGELVMDTVTVFVPKVKVEAKKGTLFLKYVEKDRMNLSDERLRCFHEIIILKISSQNKDERFVVFYNNKNGKWYLKGVPEHDLQAVEIKDLTLAIYLEDSYKGAGSQSVFTMHNEELHKLIFGT